jgi:hypothetical protein
MRFSFTDENAVRGHVRSSKREAHAPTMALTVSGILSSMQRVTFLTSMGGSHDREAFRRPLRSNARTAAASRQRRRSERISQVARARHPGVDEPRAQRSAVRDDAMWSCDMYRRCLLCADRAYQLEPQCEHGSPVGAAQVRCATVRTTRSREERWRCSWRIHSSLAKSLALRQLLAGRPT